MATDRDRRSKSQPGNPMFDLDGELARKTMDEGEFYGDTMVLPPGYTVLREVLFSVQGHPRPKARGRHVRGRVVSTTGKKEKLWRGLVREKLVDLRRSWEGLLPGRVEGVGVKMEAIFAMPTARRERWGKPHLVKPDGDNLIKLVMDELTKAGVVPDDSVIYDPRPIKLWAPAERAGVTVRLIWVQTMQ